MKRDFVGWLTTIIPQVSALKWSLDRSWEISKSHGSMALGIKRREGTYSSVNVQAGGTLGQVLAAGRCSSSPEPGSPSCQLVCALLGAPEPHPLSGPLLYSLTLSHCFSESLLRGHLGEWLCSWLRYSSCLSPSLRSRMIACFWRGLCGTGHSQEGPQV